MLVVRTYFDTALTASNLMIGVRPDWTVRQQLFIVDPPKLLTSNSGEARLTRRFVDGDRLHQLHFNLRMRDRSNQYGGSAVLDLGATTIDSPVDPLTGPFVFGAQSLDQLRQVTGGIAYEGRWRGAGELSIGVQKTDYHKHVSLPGLALSTTRATPWLYSVAGAANVRDDLAVYASYTRGLEESGTAPSNAANRDEPLPAILTNQRDAGLRWALTPKLRLVAGAFDLRKPYLLLDAANVFTRLGEQRHRGVELSLAGELTLRLNVVAGALVLEPSVSGQGVALGRVGKIPVNQPRRNLRLNVDWRPPGRINSPWM
ncbi:TonB-dependent receptor domain-containing protein [Xanthomonas translucens]|uniref:TonB-dependent receptor domain-containing protein n=1 Tax=Xanthomonas campestris pv. translucens TaxID=343 RepID=UPI000839FD04|nr:TonB-dependent receptor [Xanthomonas translucens]